MCDDIPGPTDASTETEQAVGHGLGLGRTYGATVHAPYVTDESACSALTEVAAREQLQSTAETVGR